MKSILLCMFFFLCGLGWHGSLLATPMVPGSGAPGQSDGESAVPAEISDQFSRQELSTMPEKILALRNLELRDRLGKEPDNPALLHELGTVIFQQGGIKEANALWTMAHKKEPNLTPPEVMAAVQEVFRQLAQGKKAEAEKQLAANEKQFANNPHFQLIKAEQAMRSKNFPAGEKAYLEAHKQGPKLYVTALNLGRFYEFSKRDPALVDTMYQSAIQLAPKKPEVWEYLGAFQFRQQQIKKALDSFRRVKELVPDAPIAERRLAELSMTAGDYSGAEKWYREALKIKISPEEDLLVRAALGDVLLRLGKLKEARAEIQSVLGKKEMPPLVFALASIDEVEGQNRQAEKGYRRVLQLLPDNPLAANNLAMLLLRGDGSAEEALSLVEQARKAIPNNLIIESTYGCALVQAGQYEEGVAILEAVIQPETSKDAWAHYFQAKGLQALKRQLEAQAQLRKVLAIDPNFPRKMEVEQLLGSKP